MIEDSMPTWFVEIVNKTQQKRNFSTHEQILAWLNDTLITGNTTSGDNMPEGLPLPQQDSIVILITAFYLIIFITGVFGNSITCLVIAKNKKMYTATNFYLFNLDSILLVSGLPLEIFNVWHPNRYPFSNEIICWFNMLVSETVTNVTILTITSFSVERYIAICHPFRSHAMSTLTRAIKFIVAIWVVGFFLALPQSTLFRLIEQPGGNACTVDKTTIDSHFFEVSSFLFFIIPLIVISCLYILIGNRLKSSKLGENSGGGHNIKAQRRVIRMLIAVVVTFFICWAPFHCQRLMAVYGQALGFQDNKLFMECYTVLNHISGILYFLSTCINPILYNVISRKFRAASKKTLQCCGGESGTSDMNRGSSQRSNQGHYIPLWRSEAKRVSVRSTTIPFIKQASNSSIQTNLTSPTPPVESDLKIIEEQGSIHSNRLKTNIEKLEMKMLNVDAESLRESEEDRNAGN